MESGLIQQWHKTHSPRNKRCEKTQSLHQSQTGLQDVKGAFIPLIVGLSIAAIVFHTEVTFRTIQDIVRFLKQRYLAPTRRKILYEKY